MLVCICNAISDRAIEDAIHQGASSFRDISKALGIGNGCGQCASYARNLIDDKLGQMQLSQSFHLAINIAC